VQLGLSGLTALLDHIARRIRPLCGCVIAAKKKGSRSHFVTARLEWPRDWCQKTFAQSQMKFETATSRRDLSAPDSI
jgi:hypothetical protein